MGAQAGAGGSFLGDLDVDLDEDPLVELLGQSKAPPRQQPPTTQPHPPFSSLPKDGGGSHASMRQPLAPVAAGNLGGLPHPPMQEHPPFHGAPGKAVRRALAS